MGFDTNVEEIAPLDLTGLQDPTAPTPTNFQANIVDVGGGAVGAGAGYKMGADRARSQKNIDTQYRDIRSVEKANAEAMKAHAAEVAYQNQQYQHALELRKHAMDLAAEQQKVPGYGTKNWVGSEFGGDIGNVEGSRVLNKPEAVEAGNKAVSSIRKIEAMMPGVHADPNSGLYLPPSVEARPAPAPRDPFPLVQPPARVPMPTLQTPPSVVKGSVKGTVANTFGGALAGQQLGRAIQNANEGDVAGAGLSGLTSAGAGMATFSPNPKLKLLGAGVAATAGGLNALRNYLNEREVPHKGVGGVLKKVVGAAEGPLNNFVARPTTQMKFSEAIAPHEGKYLGVNMSDRYGTHGGRMGGTGFPNFQNINPLHQANDVAWMVDNENTAKKLIENGTTFNGQPMIHTNYIGSPRQHASNKTVHADVLENFYKNLASGKLTDEQIAKINAGIAARARDTGTLKQRPFSQNFDIRDKFATQEIGGSSMDSRRALADMLGTGEGVGKTKNIAVPNYDQILQSHAEPLLEGAPTSAMGTRLFEIYNQPTRFSEAFHPDYRWTVHGKDQQVQFPAVPQSVGVRDFYNNFKSRFPDMEPHGNAWFAYPKQPQLISEDYIRNAQDLGYAQGGLTHC